MRKAAIAYLFLTMLYCICAAALEARTFKVASYNVENLFDFTLDGTEYQEYIPNADCGWTREIVHRKIANIAQVIQDLAAEVVMLQEVESKKALILLQSKLQAQGVNYPYCEIADARATAVKCAVLSRFPIVKREEILIGTEWARSILKVTIDIDGYCLILYNNHWPSKRNPESWRIACAKVLRKEIDKLGEKVDFILGGDFNSNYHEYQTFNKILKLNDTSGFTGINHTLKTITGSELINEQTLTSSAYTDGYLYNTWLEIDSKLRWSYNFFGEKNSLDSIIIGKTLYDDQGICYIDNSFGRFNPDYLFKNGAIYRWQMSKDGKHLGEGYSDHLPIFASFSTGKFQLKVENPKTQKER